MFLNDLSISKASIFKIFPKIKPAKVVYKAVAMPYPIFTTNDCMLETFPMFKDENPASICINPITVPIIPSDKHNSETNQAISVLLCKFLKGKIFLINHTGDYKVQVKAFEHFRQPLI